MSIQHDSDRDPAGAPSGTTGAPDGASPGPPADAVPATEPGAEPAAGATAELDPSDAADGTVVADAAAISREAGHAGAVGAADAAGPGGAEDLVVSADLVGPDTFDENNETDDETPEAWLLPAEPVPGRGLPAYRPPPSPAYAPHPEPVVPKRVRTSSAAAPATEPATPTATSRPTAGATPIAVPEPPPRPTASASDRRLGWQLLIAGLVLVVVAGAVAVLAIQSGGDGDAHAFGEVSAVTGDVVVRPGTDGDLRALEVGDRVVAGWLVDAPDGATATIDLAGDGVVRIDAGTRLRFVDLAVDPDTGERDRASEPAVDISGGRAWLIPGAAAGDDGVRVRAHIADGVIESEGHPVAVDCTTACTVEAPTGGVTVTTDEGVELTPVANEVLRVGPGAALDLDLAGAPSTWARQNLDADEDAGLPAPSAGDGPGIVGSAVLDGNYAIAITVVGPPTGDPIPTALQYPEGETYALELAADAGSCTVPPCAVPVTSEEGVSGTAELRDGEVALTFGLPIDCYDETYTSVVVPGIGTTAVNATLTIDAVDFDGERWHVRRVAGTGTVAATMSTTCNAGDVLGTSTSPITIAGS